MAESDEKRNRHFILKRIPQTEPFQSPQRGGGGSDVPDRQRNKHGAKLLSQIKGLRSHAEAARKEQQSKGLVEGLGLRVQFESYKNVELAFNSLTRERAGIELLNVRHEKKRTIATVFIPDGKLDMFENLIHAYLDKSKDGKKRPRNGKLLNAISKIRTAALKALWTDDLEEFPTSDEEELWWEVWLPVRDGRAPVTESFRRLAKKQGFRIAPGELQFPERTVLLVCGSVGAMKQSIQILNSIAELRRAKRTAEFFNVLPRKEQIDRLNELFDRITVPAEGEEVPHVCILDTGVNYGHPLLATVLSPIDAHAIGPNGSAEDGDGHGTEMAGLAMMGDLTEALASDRTIQIIHRLESVKLLPQREGNVGDANFHGNLTIQAVARPSITAPYRRRVFSMAITTDDDRDRGRPSAWSAVIDRLASGAEENEGVPRLFIVSAGNADSEFMLNYPDSNKTDGVHDPAQSWNALAVGAATDLVHIKDSDAEGYQPIAEAGGLSPFSTTSLNWDKQWPLKPDVVLEGGNAAVTDIYDKPYAEPKASLGLLTANYELQERPFVTSHGTSVATSLAARMAAQLMAEYPNLWPETVRALIVHSAEWTDAMRQMFLSNPQRPSKKDMTELVRCCGFGVPDFQRAMWSVQNSLTMIREDRLHPFKRQGSAAPTLGNMHLHSLPWPSQELEALGDTEVEMRVTLSYFIEPNPSARGFSGRYGYNSHGLRYDVKRAEESKLDFHKRINRQAREQEWKTVADHDTGWMIGTKSRHKGSIHSDIWKGTAIELANRGAIGVCPAQGWWKARPKLERYNGEARYSLVVSIHAPEVEVDLYTPIRQEIAAQSAIEFEPES
ncbi:MAG: S8 family peptidase [Gammaproteobacteria bacterium AqS3]|nr:S8 family peptidase [Gammaproteobacteria bacterium AqS3]